jgi:patatin-related protein
MSTHPGSAPALELRQEVRFAVVMYGGVSLAIYINGIAQELLRMVRATAPDPRAPGRAWLPYERLSGTERVYRRLAQLLGREPGEVALDEEAAAAAARAGQTSSVQRPWHADRPLHTRFVIDILSGTSAGGINSVYLAKALANGQSIDQLKQLWIEEGDLALLINDRGSRETGIREQDPPRSLLNSQRMYRKLLDALEDMDRGELAEGALAVPLVDELDLFITATDIRGLPWPLRLADQLAMEHRHRNVFQFRYAAGPQQKCGRDAVRNDFRRSRNPLLAFAARCTSAFPFAFEPMKFEDVAPILSAAGAHEHRRNLTPEQWQPYFPAYRPPPDGTLPPEVFDFRNRSFGDGGYLDNKPFSYALDMLGARRAGLAVDRKLFYIEPSPENVAERAFRTERPNALENTLAALSLARYETIREDLERILGRNRLVERVERILKGMDEDVRVAEQAKLVERIAGDDFAARDLTEMVEQQGVAYGGYHRLKIAALTDEIARVITSAADLDPGSDAFLAIRYLVRVWRDASYTAYRRRDTTGPPAATETRRTQNRFLMDYDLPYRIRRLSFVLNRIDQLSGLDARAAELMRQRGVARPPGSTEERAAFRAELARLRHGLEPVLHRLRGARETLHARGPSSRLHEDVLSTGISLERLRTLLESSTETLRLEHARWLLADPQRRAGFERIARKLAWFIRQHTKRAGAASEAVLNPSVSESEAEYSSAARSIVRHYFELYDAYDLISYPVLHASEVGEELDEVNVLRISPEDAPSLIDERDPSEPRRKLAGNVFMNFGAFLDRGWRRNDLLWGRLDGAERIVATLLSGGTQERAPVREELIRDAHLAILGEEFEEPDRERLCQLLADAIARTDANDPGELELRSLTEREIGSPVGPVLQSSLRGLLSRDTFFRFFRERYEVNRGLNPRAALRTLARSTIVIGRMLENIAQEYRLEGRAGAWIARLGRTFWGLVEVAVPGSMAALLFRHWLTLFYLFALLMIAGGTLFLNPQVQQFGLLTLGIGAATHLATLLLGDYLRGGRRLQRGARWAIRVGVAGLVAAVLALAMLGLVTLLDPALRTAFADRLGQTVGPAMRGTLAVLAVLAAVLVLVLAAVGLGALLGSTRAATAPRRAATAPAAAGGGDLEVGAGEARRSDPAARSR